MKLILHIPHASSNIPTMEGYVVDPQVLEEEILKLTDWYTDDLFSTIEDIMVKAEFSRVFCDLERFVDDRKEVMAALGMGVLYVKGDDSEVIREVSPVLRESILNNYYWPHHKRLTEAVQTQIDEYGKAVIIDCHSFPSIPFLRDLDKRPNRPDFNIGTDPFHTPEHLIELSKEFFKKEGFTLGIDWPYRGTLVPLKYYHKSKDVESIMLEVNRGLYLEEPSNKKSQYYLPIKSLINKYLKMIREAAAH